MAVGSSSMRDARDAEDALLLEQGDYDLLVAAYAEVVVQRCLIAAGDDGRDVAQDVVARLLGELRRGKRYTVPFRVVVHKVIDWTLKEHWAGKPSAVPSPDDWEPSVNENSPPGCQLIRGTFPSLRPRLKRRGRASLLAHSFGEDSRLVVCHGGCGACDLHPGRRP